MTETILGSALTAFAAGVLSFLSPCVMPLMPAYLSMVSGLSVDELRGEEGGGARHRVLFGSLAFIAGFTAIFVAGGASANVIGHCLEQVQLAEAVLPDSPAPAGILRHQCPPTGAASAGFPGRSLIWTPAPHHLAGAAGHFVGPPESTHSSENPNACRKQPAGRTGPLTHSRSETWA